MGKTGLTILLAFTHFETSVSTLGNAPVVNAFCLVTI